MHGCILRCLFVLIVSAAAPILSLAFDDPPKPFVPRQAATQKERDRRESLKQYVLGLLCERDDRLIEALKAYEEAARLDPQAPAVLKAQVPILVALERGREALAACQQALRLDPEDHAAWHLVSRLHKGMGQFAEAQKALEQGLATKSIQAHPENAQQMWLDLGGMHELAGETAPAVRALGEAVKILDQPDLLLDRGPFQRDLIVARAAETYERIGNLHRKAKQYPEAIVAYQKAQERSPQAGAARLHFNLAQLCVEQGRLQEALDNLDAYLRRQPLGVEPYEMRIQILQRMGRSGEIIPWLAKTSENDGHNLGLRGLLAREYSRAERWGDAERSWLALCQESPAEHHYQGLCRVYHAVKRDDQIITLLNRYLAEAARMSSDPAQAQARLHAKAMLAALRSDRTLTEQVVRVAAASKDALAFDTVQVLGHFADRQRQLPEAEQLFRRALALAGPEQEAAAYAGLLRTLWRARQYDAVLHLCQGGLAKAQGASQVVLRLEQAKALARLDRLDEALGQTDVALKYANEEQRFAVEHLRVRLLAQADRFAEAEAACQELLKQRILPSDQQEIRYLLSNVYNAWKKLAKCEVQLEWILRSDPDNATANNDLGYIWADNQKNLEEAEAMIRKALDIDRQQRERAGLEPEDNAAFVDSLGWVLFRRGKHAEALRELERAAKLPDGDDPVIWEHLGDVYQQLMRPAEARAAWERALKLYDDNRRRKSDERYRALQRKLTP